MNLNELKKLAFNEMGCSCPRCCDIMIEEKKLTALSCHHCNKTSNDCDNIHENWRCCEEDYGTDIIKGIKGKINMYDLWCKKCKPGSENLKSKKLVI